MFIVQSNPLLFINPPQVESIRYREDNLILNAEGGGYAQAIIKMASGETFTITKDMCRESSIDEAMQKLVWQIDVSNGMKFENEDEEERTG